MANDNWLSRAPVVVSLTLVCALLWGSAFPMLKTGYGLLQITGSTAGKLYFAGWRFLLAGAMIFAGLKILGRPLALPDKKDYLLLLLVGLLQTSLQYAFLYVGLAHTSSIKASIISGSGSFYLALLSHWMIAGDFLSFKKVVGLVTGFIGLVVLNLGKEALDFDFALHGEGFILLGVLLSAIATIVIKKATVRLHPPLMVAYQLTLGAGALLAAAAVVESPSVLAFSLPSVLILLYLSAVSALAFTIWYVLVKHNHLTKMAVYRFLIPVCGTFLSAAILPAERLGWQALVSLILVSGGMALTAEGRPPDFYSAVSRQWSVVGRFFHLRRAAVPGEANMEEALLPIDSKFSHKR